LAWKSGANTAEEVSARVYGTLGENARKLLVKTYSANQAVWERPLEATLLKDECDEDSVGAEISTNVPMEITGGKIIKKSTNV
jgi:hypothetical protein